MWKDLKDLGIIIPAEEISCIEKYEIKDDPKPYRLDIHLVGRDIDESLGLKYATEDERRNMQKYLEESLRMVDFDEVRINVHTISMIQKYEISSDPRPYRLDVVLKGMQLTHGFSEEYAEEHQRDAALKRILK